ncbi:MAG: hypothetical protein ACLGIA_08725 [Actinomycetes bacterium]
MSSQPDHEFEELEDDTRVPPRPEEVVADAGRDDPRSDDAGTVRDGNDGESSLDPEVTEQPI